jgi:predicted regulator of Ras-like GTPase activity (Roadblock/LC7/MglB family)
MSQLKDMLADLARVDGITAAVVVSRDGFVIEGVTSGGEMDTEAVGAVISAGIGASEVMGTELGVGELSQAMIEFKKGIIVVTFLGDSATLAIVADLKANLGNVRYQVKKRAAEIEKAI